MGVSCCFEAPLLLVCLLFTFLPSWGGWWNSRWWQCSEGVLRHQTSSEGKGDEASGSAKHNWVRTCLDSALKCLGTATQKRTKTDEASAQVGVRFLTSPASEDILLPLRMSRVRTQLRTARFGKQNVHAVLAKAALARSRRGKAKEEGILSAPHTSPYPSPPSPP